MTQVLNLPLIVPGYVPSVIDVIPITQISDEINPGLPRDIYWASDLPYPIDMDKGPGNRILLDLQVSPVRVDEVLRNPLSLSSRSYLIQLKKSKLSPEISRLFRSFQRIAKPSWVKILYDCLEEDAKHLEDGVCDRILKPFLHRLLSYTDSGSLRLTDLEFKQLLQSHDYKSVVRTQELIPNAFSELELLKCTLLRMKVVKWLEDSFINFKNEKVIRIPLCDGYFLSFKMGKFESRCGYRFVLERCADEDQHKYYELGHLGFVIDGAHISLVQIQGSFHVLEQDKVENYKKQFSALFSGESVVEFLCATFIGYLKSIALKFNMSIRFIKGGSITLAHPHQRFNEKSANFNLRQSDITVEAYALSKAKVNDSQRQIDALLNESMERSDGLFEAVVAVYKASIFDRMIVSLYESGPTSQIYDINAIRMGFTRKSGVWRLLGHHPVEKLIRSQAQYNLVYKADLAIRSILEGDWPVLEREVYHPS